MGQIARIKIGNKRKTPHFQYPLQSLGYTMKHFGYMWDVITSFLVFACSELTETKRIQNSPHQSHFMTHKNEIFETNIKQLSLT
jgi:hypothetical protein